MRRHLAISLWAILATSAIAVLAATAGASPSAVDVQVDIGVGPSPREARPYPDGATVNVSGLTFWAGPGAELVTPQPARITLRFELPDGISFGGGDLPDPTEQCAPTASTATCTASLAPSSGQSGVGWAWDLVAARPGSYVLRAEILETSETDPDPTNNRTTLTVVVTEAPAPPAPPSGGGTMATMVKLSPARPKAGSTVVASVRVTRGGSSVRPTRVVRAAAIGKVKVRGGAKASSGVASCLFKTPKSAKGKSLVGSVSFHAGGTAFTRRFATKLG